jgi:phosphate starvation-inducible membrane PsiE
MFSAGGYTMILGIILALSFIMGSVYFVYKLFAQNTQEILVRFILVVFTALVALFIVDKTVAWKINLLAPEQNRELFDLIKTLILMIFSYYFGTKESKQNNEKK